MSRSPRGMAFLAMLLVSSAVFAAQPPQFPNSQRYRDAGLQPATGRSGSASITARALLGKDNSTDLEVTTGALDTAAAPPGKIDKVQLKLTADQVYTQNFNNLSAGGKFELRMPGLARHEAFQVQTNVSGIDGRRTDVVTVTEIVKLRPDLAASDIQMPQRARVSVPTNISAIVREANGDVGAKGNCVLNVDGNDVDHADGIWVDAAGTVTCAFTHAFDTIGTHRVQIALNGVVPGDFDMSNNSVAGDIEIISPETNFNYYGASVGDHNFSNWGSNQGPWFGGNWSSQGRQQWANFNGGTGPIDFTRASASVTHSSDGAVISSQSYDLTQGSGWSDGPYTWRCFYAWSDYRHFSACGYTFFDGVNTTGSTWIDTARYAGDVTYHSVGWSCYYSDCWGGYYYTWNNGGRDVYGQFASIGSTYRIDVSLTDGDRTYVAHPVMTMQPDNYQYDDSYCYNDWWWGYGQVCYQNHYRRNGVSGYAYGPQ